MAEIVDTFVPLTDAREPLAQLAATALGRQAADVGETRLLRRSLDARKGHTLGFRLRLLVARPGESAQPRSVAREPLLWPQGRTAPQVVIIGSGPAGAWAALRLTEAGVHNIVIVERGKPVQPRRHDLAALQKGVLDPASNYGFGEGGAGTYSDGKLYTRSKDRPGVAAVLADLVRFGAPSEIAVESRPHVGSNRLPKVLTSLRLHLQEQGVRYSFESDFVGLRCDKGVIRAARLRGGSEIPADVVVLAVGHSSRSVYEWASSEQVAMVGKDFAVGVRLEHPQRIIDEIQYGPAAGHPSLPAAFYELKAQGEGRGVYSFCMCPGGWIVPAATEIGGVVVNGMSLSRRDSPFANAGLVVTVSAADMAATVGAGPLAGVAFQRRIEASAWESGGGANLRAPAQRLVDFLGSRPSTDVPRASYRPGLRPGDLSKVLPDFVAGSLRAGLLQMTREVPRLLHNDAVLIAPETRTSAPVRIVRDPVTLRSPSYNALFPAGEGAGYAGGIVSAALDGVRVAEAIVKGA